MIRCLIFTVALLALVHAAPPEAAAALIGPVFPAPGSPASPVSASFSSDSATQKLSDSPGVTRSYFNFDPTAWDELYWQLTGGSIGGLSFSTSNPAQATASLSGNVITWKPLAPWSFSTTAGTQNVAVQLVTTFLEADGMTALLPTDFVAGDPGYPQYLLNITAASLATWGGGFKVRQVFQTQTNIDAADYYNSFNTFGPFNTSTNAGFFYDPVPEPGSMALLASGLVGLVAARRRRRTVMDVKEIRE